MLRIWCNTNTSQVQLPGPGLEFCFCFLAWARKNSIHRRRLQHYYDLEQPVDMYERDPHLKVNILNDTWCHVMIKIILPKLTSRQLGSYCKHAWNMLKRQIQTLKAVELFLWPTWQWALPDELLLPAGRHTMNLTKGGVSFLNVIPRIGFPV